MAMPDKHSSNQAVAAADGSIVLPATVEEQSMPEINRQADGANGTAEDGARLSTLSDSEQDAITEAFNRGMSLAAASLSDMTGSEITLCVPELQILSRRDIASRLHEEAEPDITGIKEFFRGDFHGSAVLLFPTRSSFNMVRLVLKESVPPIEFLVEMEEEALLEIGNIILNACLGSLAETLGTEILIEIPHAVRGQAGQLLTADDRLEDGHVIQLKMDFGVDGVNIKSSLALVLDIASLDHFRNTLAKRFGKAA